MRVNKEDMDMTQEEWRSVFDAFVTELADKDNLIAELRGEQARVDSNKEWLKNSPTPEVGEWIGWNGGECPVHPDTVVEVVPQSGARVKWTADVVAWYGFNHVIAYRIITPYVEPPKPREFWIGGGCIFKSAEDATVGGCPDAIHVREVLDD